MDRSRQFFEALPEFPNPSASPRSPSHWPKIAAAPDRLASENQRPSDPPDHKPSISTAHPDLKASSSSARLLRVPVAPTPRPRSRPVPPSAHPSHSSPASAPPPLPH